MKKALIIFLMFAAALFASPAMAEGWWSPLQVSIWHPAQMVPDDWNIYGLRLNLLYGKNKNVWGFDLGFANTTENKVRGIQAGLINGPGDFGGIGLGGINSTRRVNGLQGGVFSVAEERLNGIQLSVVFNESPVVRGLQLNAPVFGNFAEDVVGAQISAGLTCNQAETVRGIQASIVTNNVDQSIKGCQASIFYNFAERISGIQFGLFNYAKDLKGLQIGLANMEDDSKIPFMPLFRIGN